MGGDVSDPIERARTAGLDDTAIKGELGERFRDARKLGTEPHASIINELAGQGAPWPVIGADAFYGLAGDIVRAISPHSEADPVAILIQVLAAAGNIMSRSRFYQVESDRHHSNLFAILVGASSKARKGTSWGRVRGVVDTRWTADRTKGGLSSGEGFIYEVRDPIRKWNVKDRQEDDPGVVDKRLLVIEPEFAGALAVMERHGNTLSP
jgi:hypothetical protein